MLKNTISQIVRGYLPAYANGTLAPVKKYFVQIWAKKDEAVQLDLSNLQKLQVALQTQVQQTPSSSVLSNLQTQLSPKPVPASWSSWGWGMVLAAIALAIFWSTLPPGILLQWSVTNDQFETYRLYRAPEGSDEFALLEEIPAQPHQPDYTYLDSLLVPGETYVYRVEGVSPIGQTVLSQSIVANAIDALPGQLAIILSTGILLYGLFVFAQQMREKKFSYWFMFI